MKKRNAKIERTTKETSINLELNIDGEGKYQIDIPVGFLKHMLELFTKHGLFDLTIKASGDIEVDYHHTVEDIAICLGKAFRDSLGDMIGVKRYGFFILPMDESLAETAIDISSRPYLSYDVILPSGRIGDFDSELIREFFSKFVIHAGLTMHIKLSNCENLHHGCEAIFKCVSKALCEASRLDLRIKDANTTKGIY